MKNPGGLLVALMVAGFSLLLVFGAILTVLAEGGVALPASEQPTQTVIDLDGDQPTATDILVPTSDLQPLASNTLLPASPSATLPAGVTTTATTTATITFTPTADTSAGCTLPTGWTTYKVKSGDTLFSIALLYQTTVSTLQSGNCMGTATKIITGQILLVPNNATITPAASATPKPSNTPKPTSVTCYTLTRTHTGNGADPTASPTKSAGCTTGKYTAGESISLTAAPDSGWTVSGWAGTNNNASTSTSNTVTMPAGNRTVRVDYEAVPVCYPLTRSHSGSGSNPTASPSSSAGCAAGSYTAGASISLTATPTSGWTVSGWSGTSNDASTSTSNTLTMPASAWTVSVTYIEIPPPCFTLSLTHTGAGADPTAAPTNSPGCAPGSYSSGESITLTAAPDGSGTVTGWTGTDNNSSTSTTNTLTMPGSNHIVSVIYNP
jgi:LysM repeat protein